MVCGSLDWVHVEGGDSLMIRACGELVIIKVHVGCLVLFESLGQMSHTCLRIVMCWYLVVSAIQSFNN